MRVEKPSSGKRGPKTLPQDLQRLGAHFIQITTISNEIKINIGPSHSAVDQMSENYLKSRVKANPNIQKKILPQVMVAMLVR